jgi:hypothetical protein
VTSAAESNFGSFSFINLEKIIPSVDVNKVKPDGRNKIKLLNVVSSKGNITTDGLTSSSKSWKSFNLGG